MWQLKCMLCGCRVHEVATHKEGMVAAAAVAAMGDIRRCWTTVHMYSCAACERDVTRSYARAVAGQRRSASEASTLL